MDFVNILLFCFMSCVIGAVVMLLIQYYAFVRYFDATTEQEKRNEENRSGDHQRFELPIEVLQNIKLPDADGKSPTIAINLVLQFLFYELRYRTDVRKWFYRKLSLELDELLTKTTTGKLFDKLSLRDLDIGGQFPDIKNLRVHNVELHDTEGYIENLDLILNLHYEGNFRMAIEADMVLGKKGFLSVIVKRVSGIMRLQFTRKPYTHWSLSFVGDPQIELGIESQFQGRQMQSNVTSLISNQIRKAIRRKHTLPNYKLRYKPFFHRVDEEDASDVIPDGCLEVHLLQSARLMLPEQQNITRIYCTLTVANIPWITAKNSGAEANTMVISLMVEIHKTKNQQIGIVFKQLENAVIIEAILPNTPAAKANLRKNDVLFSIEGKPVSHISHVAKIVKGISKPMFLLRIERTCAGRIQDDKVEEKRATTPAIEAPPPTPQLPPEKGSTENNIGMSFSKANDSVQLLSTKPAKGSTGSCESSQANTPTSSPRKSGLLSRSKSRSLTRNDSDGDPSASINKPADGGGGKESGESPAKKNVSRIGSMESVREEEVEVIVQHVSKEFDFNSLIHLGDASQFNLNDSSKYLNLNVIGRTREGADGVEDVLLGYTNIPVGSILSECSDSNLRNFLKKFSLQPPDCPNWSNSNLSSLSGFDANFCYGDVLISFVWNGSNRGIFYADSGPAPATSAKKSKQRDSSVETQPTKQHEFIRKHFNRTTQCDFCGKKIWLKDAVQCIACLMCCHKKCITKCQNATVCGSATDAAIISSTTTSSSYGSNTPEFKVTDVGDLNTNDVFSDELLDPKSAGAGDGHRASLGDFLAQGLKRVNSANNLAIPAIVASLSSSQGTKSLPPSPQLTPRKQSLASPSNSPFLIVANRLEAVADASPIDEEDIIQITEPLIGWGSPDEMMSSAKSASYYLYMDLDPSERLDRINGLLTKLRLALDFETSNHADLTATANELRQNREKPKVEPLKLGADSSILLQTKGAAEKEASAATADRDENQEQKIARCAFLLGQSEERVQALSVIMLHLCSGLQHAQGVAGNQ